MQTKRKKSSKSSQEASQKELRFPELSSVELLFSRLRRNPTPNDLSDEEKKPALVCRSSYYYDEGDSILGFCDFRVTISKDGERFFAFSAIYIFVISNVGEIPNDLGCEQVIKYASRTFVWPKFNDLFQCVRSQVELEMPRLPILTDEDIEFEELKTEKES